MLLHICMKLRKEWEICLAVCGCLCLFILFGPSDETPSSVTDRLARFTSPVWYGGPWGPCTGSDRKLRKLKKLRKLRKLRKQTKFQDEQSFTVLPCFTMFSALIGFDLFFECVTVWLSVAWLGDSGLLVDSQSSVVLREGHDSSTSWWRTVIRERSISLVRASIESELNLTGKPLSISSVLECWRVAWLVTAPSCECPLKSEERIALALNITEGTRPNLADFTSFKVCDHHSLDVYNNWRWRRGEVGKRGLFGFIVQCSFTFNVNILAGVRHAIL